MYIFGYFIKKGHISRAIRKKGHVDRKLWGGQTTPLSPILWRVCSNVDFLNYLSLHYKSSFPLRISSVNVTKSAVFCKTSVFIKVCRYSGDFFNRNIVAFFKTNVLKKSVFYITSTIYKTNSSKIAVIY